MSFQITKIAIYGHNKEVRVLSFRKGEVNIITGASKTGKSALIHIVKYCLGGKNSIPGGLITNNVSWFAIQVERGADSVFIARKNEANNVSCEEIYIERSKTSDVPKYENLSKNSNLEALDILLTEFSGISEFSVEPKEGQTRQTGAADISKALIYCFQEQGEVANQKFLFHRQGEPFLPQSIKDYLPFFLGIFSRQFIEQKDQLRNLRGELRKLEIKRTENERLKGLAFEKPHGLIQEAVSVGLLPQDQKFPEVWDEIKDVLNKALNTHPTSDTSDGHSEQILDGLFEEQKILREKHRIIGDEINAVQALKQGQNGFTVEANEQRARLASIGLFEHQPDVNHSLCPLCSSSLQTSVPNAQAINRNLENISKQLESVTADVPHLNSMMSAAKARQDEISKALSLVREKVEAVQESNKLIEAIRDANAKRALIKGRIGYYLESFENFYGTKTDYSKIDELKSKIEKLESETSDEEVQERLDSVLSMLSQEITTMARSLNIEHSQYPIRLDIKKLTVVADTENGALPLERMGSGETWVSLHLITYLVLQRWFARKGMPVPRFVFFDQPTQAYYPPDTIAETVKNTDREAVLKMFKFIKDASKELNIQVVIMEHADIQQDWFQEMVTEKWWDGQKKLVPIEWLDSEKVKGN